MPLYKIVKAFFIPPGLFVTIFLFLALYLFVCELWNRKYNYRVKIGINWLNIFGICFCLLCSFISYSISVNAFSQRFARSLEYMYPCGSGKVDAIFVLGGADVRARTGLKLQKNYKVDVVVSGFNGEAERLAKILINGGVAKDKIILEPKATNTKDHVKYMLPIALEKEYKRICLVTSASHMPRSMMNFYEPFKNNGIEVVPYPCGYTVPKEHKVYVPDREWLPNPYSLEQSAVAWHEYLGMFELWLERLW